METKPVFLIRGKKSEREREKVGVGWRGNEESVSFFIPK